MNYETILTSVCLVFSFSFLFVGKVTSDAALDPAGLVAIAVCHAFALFVAVSVGANISGGHVNPAVTFGLALGGQITILTGIFYWIAQLLGSIVACFLLKFVTGGLVSSKLNLISSMIQSLSGQTWKNYHSCTRSFMHKQNHICLFAIHHIEGTLVLGSGYNSV